VYIHSSWALVVASATCIFRASNVAKPGWCVRGTAVYLPTWVSTVGIVGRHCYNIFGSRHYCFCLQRLAPPCRYQKWLPHECGGRCATVDDFLVRCFYRQVSIPSLLAPSDQQHHPIILVTRSGWLACRRSAPGHLI
jgi:hypothetical protein